VIRYFGSRQKIFNVHFRNIEGLSQLPRDLHRQRQCRHVEGDVPTTVHIPAALLKSVDRRARARRVGRNRLIVKSLEQAVNQRAATIRAVDELLDDVKEARRSKPPREL
jgi:predicted transcriptional regulator